MYSAYEKVVAPDEKGVFDFIGDYLLDGKNLLGHNKQDLPFKQGTMQFEHFATFAAIFHECPPLIIPMTIPMRPAYSGTDLPFVLSDYHPVLFRPPLA